MTEEQATQLLLDSHDILSNCQFISMTNVFLSGLVLAGFLAILLLGGFK